MLALGKQPSSRELIPSLRRDCNRRNRNESKLINSPMNSLLHQLTQPLKYRPASELIRLCIHWADDCACLPVSIQKPYYMVWARFVGTRIYKPAADLPFLQSSSSNSCCRSKGNLFYKYYTWKQTHREPEIKKGGGGRVKIRFGQKTILRAFEINVHSLSWRPSFAGNGFKPCA